MILHGSITGVCFFLYPSVVQSSIVAAPPLQSIRGPSILHTVLEMLDIAYSLHAVAIDTDTDSENITKSAFYHKHRTLRYTITGVCLLSMIGALLIILSYICIPQIRTRARLILVHLSVADFGVACSNFIGLTVYFDRFIERCEHSCTTINNLCTAQAFFAGYSTLASILWTLLLAVYIYCLVVHSQRRLLVGVIYVGCVLCWGIPLLVLVWLLATGEAS